MCSLSAAILLHGAHLSNVHHHRRPYGAHISMLCQCHMSGLAQQAAPTPPNRMKSYTTARIAESREHVLLHTSMVVLGSRQKPGKPFGMVLIL